MGIFEAVSEELKTAMRNQDKERTSALRNIRAAFILGMKEDNSTTLSDDKCVGILRKMVKQRQESIEAYTQGGRPELAAAEKFEVDVIGAWLPKLADEAAMTAWVKEAIAATGATSPKEMGKVMGAVMKSHKDEVDSKVVQRIAASLLGG